MPDLPPEQLVAAITTAITESGYEPELNLFAGLDLQRRRTFTIGSPSVEIARQELRGAGARCAN